MDITLTARTARLLLLLVAVAALAQGVLTLTLPWLRLSPAPPGPTDLGFTDLVGAGCASALLGCTAWLSAGTVIVAVRSCRADPAGPSLRWVPRTIRLLVPVLVGAAATTGPAHASTDPTPTSRHAVTVVGATALTGLPVPGRVLTVAATPVAATTVVVSPGDTLWGIAARRLPTSASDAAIDRGWRRIARANATLLPDPHLLRPGIPLRIPPLTAHAREEAR